jgi:hypothetical protein
VATNRPIIHPPGDNEFGKPKRNNIDRGKLKNSFLMIES